MGLNYRYSQRIVAARSRGTFRKKTISFKSKAELSFAEHLEFLRESGRIRSWEYEPHGSTFWFYTIRRGVRSYKADFRVVTNTGQIQWYELKGYLNPKSMTKLRRMHLYHPDVILILVMMRDDKRDRRNVDAVRPFLYAVSYLDKVLARYKGTIK